MYLICLILFYFINLVYISHCFATITVIIAFNLLLLHFYHFIVLRALVSNYLIVKLLNCFCLLCFHGSHLFCLTYGLSAICEALWIALTCMRGAKQIKFDWLKQCMKGAPAVNGHNHINYTMMLNGKNKQKNIAANNLSLWLRWDVAVGREAAGVYQQSNGATERNPEAHWQGHTQCEDGKIKTLRQRFFFYLKAVFSTVNIYSFFFNNNKTADKDCLKNYFSVSRNVSHTHTHTRSVDVS